MGRAGKVKQMAPNSLAELRGTAASKCYDGF